MNYLLILPIVIFPYIVLILWLYKYLVRIKPFNSSADQPVFVSVVIACRNEQDNIPGLLHSLSQQKYPFNLFEVILVDDNSTDKTVAAAQSYAYNLNLKVLANEGTGKKTALKTGIRAAMGNLILTTDADCFPCDRWITTIVSFYSEYNPDLIIAPVKLSRGMNFFGRFQELEFLSLQGITAATAEGGIPVMCNGANLAFTKSVYLSNIEHLRFDIATGDDIFLLHSLKKNKSNILWLESAGAIVETAAVPDLKSFLKQRKRWASKSTAYRDFASVYIGIVTFVTNLAIVVFLMASFFDNEMLIAFITSLLIKSIPDYLILRNTTGRYGNKELMKSFLQCQMIYPFYVMIVTGFAFIDMFRMKKMPAISSPSLKGI
ncbi:MAG TPA: glycosyltransferase [Bacteroidales bacterium]|nr:glycosyltransferase [Bacteroidales bacterium]